MLSALARRLMRRFNLNPPFVFVTMNTPLENGHDAESINVSNIKRNSHHTRQLAIRGAEVAQ